MHGQKFQNNFCTLKIQKIKSSFNEKILSKEHLYSLWCTIRVSFSFVRKYFNNVDMWGLSWGIVKLLNLTECRLAQGGSETSFVHKIGRISSTWKSLFYELIFEFKRSLVVNWFTIVPFLFIILWTLIVYLFYSQVILFVYWFLHCVII